MTTPKKTDPLTVDEMTKAADHFVSLLTVITDRCPKASIEDALRIMESTAKFAHAQRAKAREEKVTEKFGFNKDDETETV